MPTGLILLGSIVTVVAGGLGVRGHSPLQTH